jgi:hypothetical protein
VAALPGAQLAQLAESALPVAADAVPAGQAVQLAAAPAAAA